MLQKMRDFARRTRGRTKGGSEIRLMMLIVGLAAVFVLLLIAVSAFRSG
ncbi:hypothetical protein [uncultured Enterovirga sp.]